MQIGYSLSVQCLEYGKGNLSRSSNRAEDNCSCHHCQIRDFVQLFTLELSRLMIDQP